MRNHSDLPSQIISVLQLLFILIEMAEKHFISFSLIVPLKCTVLGSDLVHVACKADCDLGHTQAHPSHHESDSGKKKKTTV